MKNLLKSAISVIRLLKKTPLELYVAEILARQSPSSKKKLPVVLLQAAEDLYSLIIFGILTQKIEETKNINVYQNSFRSLVEGESSRGYFFYIKSRVVARLLAYKWANIYASYVKKIALQATKCRPYYDFLDFFRAYRAWNNLSSEDDVLAMSIDGVVVGDLIYDSYLRYKPSYYISIKDWYLLFVIWQAYKNSRSANVYFKKNKVSLFLVVFSTYIQHGIYVRLALANNIPVYSFGNFQNFSKKLELDDLFHTKYSERYSSDFFAMPKSIRDQLLSQANEMLEHRICGGVDSATAYMRKSAYLETTRFDIDVSNSVVVFLHDFYDSPHVFYDMVFSNFWEWACFTIDTLQNARKKFFVKVHPNQIGLSGEVVSRLLARYPDLVIIPQNITNLQLINAGIRVGVTVYGTVAHELAFLGISSICCARHPHISFDFCLTAKTREEYRNILLSDNIGTLTRGELKEQSLIFYAMHNLNISRDEIDLKKHLMELRNLLSDSDSLNQAKKNEIKKIINHISCNAFVNNFIEEVFFNSGVSNESL